MDFIRRKWGIPIRDIWFEDSRESKGFSMINIAYNHYEPLKRRGFTIKHWRSTTLVSDISVSPEEILANFKSRVRNEIRRAVKEGITTKLFLCDDLAKSNIINKFDKAYIAMYKDKGQNAKSIAHRLRGIARVGKLVISVAYLPDGKIAAYHSYVVDKKTTRLLHSVSVFRENPKKKMMIGWANRLLHYKDMCVFGEYGVLVYDWGGISREGKMINIARFKEEFGGQERITFYRISMFS